MKWRKYIKCYSYQAKQKAQRRVNTIKQGSKINVFFKCMAGREESYVMAENKHFLTVTFMCIKTEIVSIMIRRIPEIE